MAKVYYKVIGPMLSVAQGYDSNQIFIQILCSSLPPNASVSNQRGIRWKELWFYKINFTLAHF